VGTKNVRGRAYGHTTRSHRGNQPCRHAEAMSSMQQLQLVSPTSCSLVVASRRPARPFALSGDGQFTRERERMKFRKPLKITQRVSSVTNSFVQAIIPWVEPTSEELEEALGILGMTLATISCAYCGGNASDWDHLRPLVKAKRPTGFISEIKNLVPACGNCNQSKGGADWQVWIVGAARGAPKQRGIADLDDRIEKLRRYEEWGDLTPLPLREWAGPELWDAHWQNLIELESRMQQAQLHALKINAAISAVRKGG